MILESLEIKVRPGAYSDSKYLNLTWELMSFDEKLIFIQLYYDYPSEVSSKELYDTLEVHFWGTEFFKSASDGEQVRYGTMLERTIMR